MDKNLAVISNIITLGVALSNKDVAHYIRYADVPELPAQVRQFFEEYSNIPVAKVQTHVLEVIRHTHLDSGAQIRSQITLGAISEHI